MSPQGTLLAAARFAEVELRAIGGVLRKIGPLAGKVNAVHFSADGSQLVTASGVTGLRGVASIWNVADGALVREFSAHRDTLYDAELSPDGKVLATAGHTRLVGMQTRVKNLFVMTRLIAQGPSAEAAHGA